MAGFLEELLGGLPIIGDLFGGKESPPQAPQVPTLPVGQNILQLLPMLQSQINRPPMTGLALPAQQTYEQQMNRLLGSLRASGLRGSTGTSAAMGQGAANFAGNLANIQRQGEQSQLTNRMNLAQLLQQLYTGQAGVPFQNYNAQLQQYAAQQQNQQNQLAALSGLAQLAQLWTGGGKSSPGTAKAPYGSGWYYDPMTGKMVFEGNNI